ncbi:serine carboxypeptidase-like protein 16 [Tanacetum coccineum]
MYGYILCIPLNDKFMDFNSRVEFALRIELISDDIYNGNLIEQRNLHTQHATYEYLKGKILDIFTEYLNKAKDHLSKAVQECYLFYDKHEEIMKEPSYDNYSEVVTTCPSC